MYRQYTIDSPQSTEHPTNNEIAFDILCSFICILIFHKMKIDADNTILIDEKFGQLIWMHKLNKIGKYERDEELNMENIRVHRLENETNRLRTTYVHIVHS